MADEHRSRRRSPTRARLEVLDRLEVEVVGRPRRGPARSRRARPAPRARRVLRSPGDRDSPARWTSSAPSPSFASAPRASPSPRPVSADERAQQRARTRRRSGPLELAEDGARANPAVAGEQRQLPEQRPRSRVVLPAPLSAEHRDAVAVRDLEVEGAEAEVAAADHGPLEPGDDRARAVRRRRGPARASRETMACPRAPSAPSSLSERLAGVLRLLLLAPLAVPALVPLSLAPGALDDAVAGRRVVAIGPRRGLVRPRRRLASNSAQPPA